MLLLLFRQIEVEAAVMIHGIAQSLEPAVVVGPSFSRFETGLMKSVAA